jgi:hypothetical protein
VTAGKFLEVLWGEKPEDLWILIWTLPDQRSYWCTDIAHATMLAENLAKTCDVYIGVGLRSKDLGAKRRGGIEDVTCICGMWGDIDLRSLAHQKENLPATASDGLQILPAGVPPTIVVHTGNGLHVWWIFKEPWILETPEEHDRAVALAGRWQTMLRQNAAMRGWGFDRLSDVSRVLRIPGTTNHKDPEHLKEVVVTEWHPEIRYEPGDIDEILDGFGIPDATAAQQAAAEWAARFKDTPLNIDVSRRFPVANIDLCSAEDMRFKNTWLRQRHDLKDQSQSGYDMALAMFGADTGLSEQAIVDLIITHRALHHQKQRTNPDYYQRTIAKAFKGSTVKPAPLPELPGVPETKSSNDGAAGTADGPAPGSVDPARAKVILCEALSEVLGIHILRIVKITGQNPSYRIDLDKVTVEITSPAKFMEQGSVRTAVFGQSNEVMNTLKPRDWDQVVKKMALALTEKEGGEEASLNGSAGLYLSSYLSETQFISSIKTQTIQTIRKPTVLEEHPGQIAICANDLRAYLTKVLSEKVSAQDVARMLSSIGGQLIHTRGKFREQTRWLLPAKDFAPKQYMSHIQEQKDEGVSA